MADNNEEIIRQQVRSFAEKDAESIRKDWEQGLITTEDALREFSKVTRETTKNISRTSSEFAKIIAAQEKYTNSLTKQALEQTKQSSFFGRAKNWLYTSSSKDDMATQYRARQVAGGIESIMSGNLASGFRQLGSTVPRIAQFMGGPYYLAIQTVVSGLIKFDSALAKSAKTMTLLTGGLSSDYVSNRGAAYKQRYNLKESLREIGLQGNIDEIMQSISSSYGQAYSKNNLSNLVKTTGYAQRGLEAFGISAQSAQGLISNLQLIEGKNQQGVYAQLQRLTNRFSSMSMFSPEQALQQATSLYDQTKQLGTNFEWASRMVSRFEKGLKDGTLALSDFAAVNRSLRGGNISSNAGIASLVSDYASRSGISLPSSFTRSNAIGQSFAISTRAMLSNNQFAKAYQGQLQEMLDQMGMSTKEERAGALQLLLQSRGINISPEAASGAIRNDGTIDLIGQGIIGGKAFQKSEKEAEEAARYQEQVRKYYEGTTPYHELMKKWIGGMYAKFVGNSVATGVSEGMSTNSLDIIRNLGAFFGPTFWKQLKDSFDSPLMKNVGIYSTSYSSATQTTLVK